MIRERLGGDLGFNDFGRIMLSAEVIKALASVSSLFGLLGIFGYLYFLNQTRYAERSIRQIVEGEGLFNSKQIVKILEQFKDDSARLEALKTIANLGARQADAVLEKVKNNVDLNRLNSASQRHYRQISGIAGVFFLALAFVGLAQSFFSSAARRVSVPTDVTLLDPKQVGQANFELGPPNQFVPVLYTLKGTYTLFERTVTGVAKGSVEVTNDLPKMYPESIRIVGVRLCSLKVVEGIEQMYAVPDNPKDSNSISTDIKISPGAKAEIPEFKFQVTLPEEYDINRTWICGALWNGPGYFPAQ